MDTPQIDFREGRNIVSRVVANLPAEHCRTLLVQTLLALHIARSFLPDLILTVLTKGDPEIGCLMDQMAAAVHEFDITATNTTNPKENPHG